MKKSYVIVVLILSLYLVIMYLLFANQTQVSEATKKVVKDYFPVVKEEGKLKSTTDGVEKVKQKLNNSDNLHNVSYNENEISEINREYFEKKLNVKLDNLVINQKVTFDFDKDRKKEQIIVISNVDTEKNTKSFSAIYYIDEEVLEIKTFKYSEINSNNIKFILTNVVKFNKNYGVIITEEDSNGKFLCYGLYKLSNNDFETIVQCDTSYLN